ncbi:MAG: hypothetical protein DWQ19_11220 [Crenarchaeota archaeon]|nr:MAG: hypothetical protein DWQ19_11220 [Thermoproteota archaeon]
MNFKLWLENIEAKREGIKGTILNFLKDKLNLDDDQAVLSLSLSSIGHDVLTDLIHRGLISTSDDMTIQTIKNRTGTVHDLIDLLADSDSQLQEPPLASISNET